MLCIWEGNHGAESNASIMSKSYAIISSKSSMQLILYSKALFSTKLYLLCQFSLDT